MSQNGTKDSKAPKPDPLKPPHRRLVVMFDGTGNTRGSMTNVSRMFEAIDDSHPESYKPIGDPEAKGCRPLQSSACTKIVHCEKCNQSPQGAKHGGDDSEANLRAGVPCSSCRHQVVREPELQPVQLVKYIKGVGTTWWGIIGRYSAQAVGYGLSDKIKEGYTWLCNHYEEGDEIFVFGFSRGAFAARSLVSLLCKCGGILKKKAKSDKPVYLSFDDKTKDDKNAIDQAYDYYRAYVESPDETNEARSKGVKLKGAKLIEAKLKKEAKQTTEEKQENSVDKKTSFDIYLEGLKGKYSTDSSTGCEYTITRLTNVKVKMLGVWDTVGALAIPETGYSTIDNLPWSRAQYQFHNQSLTSIVQNAYHALALEEHREAFKPTLWTSRTSTEQEVKQVWFVGSHCNVGGGADLDDNDDPDDLWQYPYVWMQRHAEKHGLRFYWSFEYPATRQANSHSRTRWVSLRKPEPSLENFVYGLYNMYKKLTPWNVTPYIRETDPKLAMLHWSVIERITVTEDDRKEAEKKNLVKKAYRPPSLFMRKRSYDGFMASVIPECVIALDQVAEKGTLEVAPWKWHIETDDVNLVTPWGLPLPQKEEKEDGPEPTRLQMFVGYLDYYLSRFLSRVYKLAVHVGSITFGSLQEGCLFLSKGLHPQNSSAKFIRGSGNTLMKCYIYFLLVLASYQKINKWIHCFDILHNISFGFLANLLSIKLFAINILI